MDDNLVTYLMPEGEEDEIGVEAKDTDNTAEAAREKLTAEYPWVDSDEWEILSVRLSPSDPAP